MSIPLAILGGYLGAGKTTLVNRLLREPHGARLTVLVNDLGKVNIDAELIADHNGTTLTLTNGCACCQMQEDLTSQLMMLVADSRPPDAVLIEASGAGERHGLRWPVPVLRGSSSRGFLWWPTAPPCRKNAMTNLSASW